MSIFQNSVLKTFKQDEKLVALRWAAFQNYKAKVEAIKDFKEEEYQDGFLKDIFESCLGYTLKTTNPSSFNLEREKKNETDSKKADGVIYLNSEIIAVIELKDTKTKNLDRVQQQAFWYLTQHTKAKYVIISNFDELRFYFDKSTAYESFSLFNLSYDEFCKLHLLLSFENIKDETALKIKEKSNSFEQDISKKLYKDFSNFRTLLFENIVKNNPTIDKQTLLRLTQKLCDRIIFILFAEDRDLLRANMIKEIREEFINQKFTNYSLYDIYKFYFEAINKGNDKLQIPQYNGGLFATDLLLDSLIIDDFILDENVQILSNYDFASEISVNILGHIFEQSLTDLEELQANIDNVNFDKTKSKRKKDGVFYTPEYITRYIVENTLGKMCSEKREELQIGSETLVSPSNPKKLTKQEQQTKDNLQEYKNWLLNLKILDPACGSGAFLNQALEYLISEHKNLQNDLALMGDLFASYMVEEEILENNLYGVDINEDAVEIAKLSLWLRTAKRGRPLTKLADKIVCANSLLEMPFSENSFDVVIGNPPYVRVQGLKSNYENEAKLYEEKFVSATGKYDLYVLFMEQSFKMLNQNGKLSYILPHKFLVVDAGKGIRGFLSEHRAVESLLHFGSEMVFEDASTYTCIINLSHNNEKINFKSISPKNIFNTFEYDFMTYDLLNSDKWNLQSNKIINILNKIKSFPKKFNNVFSDNFKGVDITMGDDVYMMNGIIQENLFIGYSNRLNKYVELEKEIIKPLLKGQDIKKYNLLNTNLYVIYPHYLDLDNTKPYTEEELSMKFPRTYTYFLNFKEEFIEKKKKYKTNSKYWYSLHRARSITNFETKKLITPFISEGSNFTFDDGNSFFNANNYGLIKKENEKCDIKFFLTILNSNLTWFLIKNTSSELRGGFFQYSPTYLQSVSFPKLENLEQQEPFIKKADLMLELNKRLQETKQNFYDELKLEKLTTKLQKFEELDFDDFVKEYAKAKKLKFADKLEERNFKNDWQRLFENDKKEVLEIQNQINITDKEIDEMVYKLYDLTEDEIKIVEGV
ncbi:Eco57I restriction-modification methylase domain-containing protein [Aliarcobacter skirrowii]|uniref:Eco57I restriction-modification methylase domain-containing protein n=1 Tax=Aliarcobacter skirrowii TaxID=28200 RepID=UPI0021B41A00|nr:N-6 DNA methylase [Aliarcobacter skirrowii]MCT7447301.1 N-6 DNA methylase [Aliarcobacter skirrowii]